MLHELQDLLPVVTNSDCVDNEWDRRYPRHSTPQVYLRWRPPRRDVLCWRSRSRTGHLPGGLWRTSHNTGLLVLPLLLSLLFLQALSGAYQLIGAVSWGVNCAKSYGVYADVPCSLPFSEISFFSSPPAPPLFSYSYFSCPYPPFPLLPSPDYMSWLETRVGEVYRAV